MKRLAYKLPLLFCLLFALQVTATPTDSPAEPRREFVKEINKSFPLSATGRLELSNRHGSINVQSWNQDKVTIDIKILVQAGDQETANQVFDRVQINFTDTDNLVSAVTSISSVNKSWWDRLVGGFNSDDFKIIYTVKMPNRAFLSADGQYCNINCGDHAGELDVNVQYGNVDLGEIGERVQVRTKYGNTNIEGLASPSIVETGYGNLDIDKASSELDINIRYGELRIDEANDLILDSRYTDMRIGKVGKMRFKGSYGDIRIREVRSIRASTTYSGYEIEKVMELADISTAYGDVEIDWVNAGFNEIRVKGSYSDIEVRMDPEAGYELNARTSYSDIDYPSGLDINRKERKSNSESISGKKSGKGNGRLELATAYGDISVRD